MCKLSSITNNQAAFLALCRGGNRYVGNLAPMPGVFPDYKVPIVRNGAEGRELRDGKLKDAIVAASPVEATRKCAAKLEAGIWTSVAENANIDRQCAPCPVAASLVSAAGRDDLVIKVDIHPVRLRRPFVLICGRPVASPSRRCHACRQRPPLPLRQYRRSLWRFRRSPTGAPRRSAIAACRSCPPVSGIASTMWICFGHAGRSAIVRSRMLLQLVRGRRGAGPQRDVAHRQFAGIGVGHADRGGQRHRGMRRHRVLDHQRVDVVAAADDQVLGAAGDVEPAAVVGVAEVAAVEHAVVEDAARRARDCGSPATRAARAP